MRHPDCRRDATACRITQRYSIAPPVLEWEPVYDGNGFPTNVNPNTHVIDCACETCGGEWQERRSAGLGAIVLPVRPIVR